MQTVTDTSGLAIIGDTHHNYTLIGSTGLVSVGNTGLEFSNTVSGNASFVTDAPTHTTTIMTASDKTVLNWLSFSVLPDENVYFSQPSSSSIVLNRVVAGGYQSKIDGSLGSNGKIFIVNPYGVIFGAGSVVNTTSLLASTQNIANADFLAGNYLFGNNSAYGEIVNNGTLSSSDGGYIALIGNGINNTGTITSHGGTILFAGGEGVTLNENGGALQSYTVASADKSVHVSGTLDISSTSGNGGIIGSEGILSVADNIAISALGTSGNNGYWLLQSNGDYTIGQNYSVNGVALTNILKSVDASIISATGDININDAVNWSANTLTLSSLKDINIANILTISGSGSLTASYGESYYIQQNVMSTDNLDTNLVTYGLKTSFAKDAQGNHLNDFAGRIDISGTGSVKMGITGQTLLSYNIINSVSDLQAIGTSDSSAAQNYVIGSDLDLSGIADWTPLGYYYDGSTLHARQIGSINGFGQTISNLSSTQGGLIGITMPVTSTGAAFLGYLTPITGGALYANIGLKNINIDTSLNTSSSSVGGFANNFYGQAQNIYVSGNIITGAGSQYSWVGGIAGDMLGGIADNVYSSVNIVSGFTYVGGFAGLIDANTAYPNQPSFIARSSASGTVRATSGDANVGGFVGTLGHFVESFGSFIVSSSASGAVSGEGGYIGGFAGSLDIYSSMIVASNASGSVYINHTDGDNYAGGFVGFDEGWLFLSSSSGLVHSSASDDTGDTSHLGGFGGTGGDLARNFLNFFDKETAGIDHDGTNWGTNHGGHLTQQWVDSFNSLYGTSLTYEQLQSNGGTALTNAEFNTVLNAQNQNGSSMETTTLKNIAGALSNKANGKDLGLSNTGNSNDSGGGSSGSNTTYSYGTGTDDGLENSSSIARSQAAKIAADRAQAARYTMANQAQQLASNNQAQAQKQSSNTLNNLLAFFNSNSEKLMGNVDIVNPTYETGVKNITVDGVTYMTEEPSENDDKKKKAH